RARRRTRIAVAGNRNPRLRGAKSLDRRFAALREAIESNRQQYGYGARSGQGGRILRRCVLQVIARERTVARRHLAATEIGELLGVHLDRQTDALRGLEHLLRLRQVETNGLTK